MWKTPKRARDAKVDEALVAQLGAVYDVARRLTGSRNEAEDLTQETFGRALEASDRFEPGTSARAWLLTILHNLFRNRLRDGSRHPQVELDEELDIPAATADDEPPLWAALTPEVLDEGIATLPLKLREVVVLRDLQGLSYRQLADVLSVPSGTVMSRLHRGRGQLKAWLSKRLGEGSASSLDHATACDERLEAKSAAAVEVGASGPEHRGERR